MVIVPDGDDRYSVIAMWGKRTASRPNCQVKQANVTLGAADAEYNSLLYVKRRKGYDDCHARCAWSEESQVASQQIHSVGVLTQQEAVSTAVSTARKIVFD